MPGFHHGFGHGFDRGFGPGPGPGFGGVIPLIGTILWIALLAMIAIALIRWLSARDTPTFWYHPPTPPPPMYQPNALEILRQRYARGEIDYVTYQQMRERLGASTSPGQQRHL